MNYDFRFLFKNKIKMINSSNLLGQFVLKIFKKKSKLTLETALNSWQYTFCLHCPIVQFYSNPTKNEPNRTKLHLNHYRRIYGTQKRRCLNEWSALAFDWYVNVFVFIPFVRMEALKHHAKQWNKAAQWTKSFLKSPNEKSFNRSGFIELEWRFFFVDMEKKVVE